MKSSIPVLALASLIAAFALGSARGPIPCAEAEAETRDAGARTGNAFAFRLYGRLGQAPGNLFFSPFSVRSALALVYGGARGNTARQLARVAEFPADPGVTDLRVRSRKEEGFQLNVANSLWIQKGFPVLDSFLKQSQELFGAVPRELDFAQSEPSRAAINGWVEKETQEKIRNLIPPGALGEATRLVIANAIYLKAKWVEPFTKEATRPESFKVGAGNDVKVSLMSRQGFYGYSETPDAQLLELEYQGGAASMVVMLPKKSAGLGRLEASLRSERLDGWLKGIHPQEVEVHLPRFRTESSFSLGEPLQALGLTDAFAPEVTDFSGITGKKDLVVSAVIHQAFAAVDEEGTEAAAATALMMVGTAMPMERKPPPVFRADHPFLYLIRDKQSGSILFLGRLSQPEPVPSAEVK